VGLGEWELDHIEPRKHGGTDARSNLRVVHKACNRSRGARVAAPGDRSAGW
jgi:5-methylcytosine-specific restriction endonuclease McrA